MVMRRGEVCWVDFGEPQGSTRAKRRPAVMIQSDQYNRFKISTVVVLPITSNTELAQHPGNVFLPPVASGLAKDSVVNVSQPMTVDRSVVDLTTMILPTSLMDAVDAGLRRVVDL